MRKFRIAHYEGTLNQVIRLEEALPPTHLARFSVNIIARLDLSEIYKRYSKLGGEAIAPEVLLGLLFYGYATGVFSSRKIEKATYESIPFRFIAGGLHPDHDTIAHFRKSFLKEIQELFVQILLLARAVGVFKLGNISIDGSKVHADASKSHAVSYGSAVGYHYGRLIELEAQLQKEVHELFRLGEQACPRRQAGRSRGGPTACLRRQAGRAELGRGACPSSAAVGEAGAGQAGAGRACARALRSRASRV